MALSRATLLTSSLRVGASRCFSSGQTLSGPHVWVDKNTRVICQGMTGKQVFFFFLFCFLFFVFCCCCCGRGVVFEKDVFLLFWFCC